MTNELDLINNTNLKYTLYLLASQLKTGLVFLDIGNLLYATSQRFIG